MVFAVVQKRSEERPRCGCVTRREMMEMIKGRISQVKLLVHVSPPGLEPPLLVHVSKLSRHSPCNPFIYS
jgi:hypothetical protein